MNQELRFKKIQELLSIGATVVLHSGYSAIKLTKKHADLIRFHNGDLQITSGKKWVCVNFHTIKAYK